MERNEGPYNGRKWRNVSLSHVFLSALEKPHAHCVFGARRHLTQQAAFKAFGQTPLLGGADGGM